MSIGRFILAMALLIMSASASSPSLGTEEASNPGPSGLYFKRGQGEDLYAAPLLGTDVGIQISGTTALVRVRQHFHNPSNEWLEGVYVFPLPETSAVNRLTMQIGERRIQGKIHERQQAQRIYQNAVSAGQRASLLSSERPNIFITRLANIGPGQTIVVEFEYPDTVRYLDGAFSYRFPLVVNPRYTPRGPMKLVALPPTPDEKSHPVSPALKRISSASHWKTEWDQGQFSDLFGPVRDPERGQINPVRLMLDLNAGIPIATVDSPNHRIDVKRVSDNDVQVSLAAGTVPADQDFVLHWRPDKGEEPLAGLLSETFNGARHVLISLLAPESTASPDRKRQRDLVLVLDKSGSMHGDAIKGAKAAAKAALQRLNPEDRFNIIAFNQLPDALFSSVQPASDANIAEALTLLEELQANGGTEMAGALKLALGQPSPKSRIRQVIFLTDGSVSNERQLTGMIDVMLGETRLFTVAVGPAPNSFFMRRAAEAGRGAFIHIDDVSEISAKTDVLYRMLEHPALTDITLDWQIEGAAEIEVFPSRVPDLYTGNPLRIAVRLPNLGSREIAGSLNVSGTLGDRLWSRRIPLDDLQQSPGVAALWGRSKVADLRNSYPVYQPDWTEMRQQVVATALSYSLVTEFTSLVAVDDEVVRPQDEALATKEIERNLPDSMSFEKVFGDSGTAPAGLAPVPEEVLQQAAFQQMIGLPVTATPADEMVRNAVIALIVAAIVLSMCLLSGRSPAVRRS